MRSHRLRPAPATRSAFAGFRFPPDVIVLAVRWCLRFGLSYRDVEELLAERGIEVDHMTVYRWVQRFTALLAEPERATQRLLERLIDAQLRPNGPSSRPRRPRLRLHQAGAVRGGAHLLAGKPRPLPGAWRPRWAGRSAPRPWRRPERGSPVSASPGDPAAPNGYPPCLGVGRTPSCCMRPSRSPSTHCSTILPSAIR